MRERQSQSPALLWILSGLVVMSVGIFFSVYGEIESELILGGVPRSIIVYPYEEVSGVVMGAGCCLLMVGLGFHRRMMNQAMYPWMAMVLTGIFMLFASVSLPFLLLGMNRAGVSLLLYYRRFFAWEEAEILLAMILFPVGLVFALLGFVQPRMMLAAGAVSIVSWICAALYVLRIQFPSRMYFIGISVYLGLAAGVILLMSYFVYRMRVRLMANQGLSWSSTGIEKERKSIEPRTGS